MSCCWSVCMGFGETQAAREVCMCSMLCVRVCVPSVVSSSVEESMMYYGCAVLLVVDHRDCVARVVRSIVPHFRTIDLNKGVAISCSS